MGISVSVNILSKGSLNDPVVHESKTSVPIRTRKSSSTDRCQYLGKSCLSKNYEGIEGKRALFVHLCPVKCLTSNKVHQTNIVGETSPSWTIKIVMAC